MMFIKKVGVLVTLALLLTSCLSMQKEPSGAVAYLKRADSRFVPYHIYADPYQCTGESIIRDNFYDISSPAPKSSFAKIPANQLVSIKILSHREDDSPIISFYPKANQYYQINYTWPTYDSHNIFQIKVGIINLRTHQSVNFTYRKTHMEGLAGFGGAQRCNPLTS